MTALNQEKGWGNWKLKNKKTEKEALITKCTTS